MRLVNLDGIATSNAAEITEPDNEPLSTNNFKVQISKNVRKLTKLKTLSDHICDTDKIKIKYV